MLVTFFSLKTICPTQKNPQESTPKFFTVSPLKHDGTGRVRVRSFPFVGFGKFSGAKLWKNFQGVPVNPCWVTLKRWGKIDVFGLGTYLVSHPQPVTWMTRVETAFRIGVSFVPSYEALNKKQVDFFNQTKSIKKSFGIWNWRQKYHEKYTFNRDTLLNNMTDMPFFLFLTCLSPRSRFKLKFSPDKVDTMIIQAAEDVGWARVCLKLMMIVLRFFARQKIALQFSFIYIRCVCVFHPKRTGKFQTSRQTQNCGGWKKNCWPAKNWMIGILNMHLETCVNLLVPPLFPDFIFPQLVYFTLANLSDMQPFGVRQLVCWTI